MQNDQAISILFYPITLEGRRGSTDEFATIPFHLDLFLAALVELAKSIPVHSLILSSHLFFCLPLFLFPFAVCPVGLSLLNQKTLTGWSGGAMVLGKLPVPGHPTIWMIVGQGPIALVVGAGGGCFDIFTLRYLFSPLSPSLGGGPI